MTLRTPWPEGEKEEEEEEVERSVRGRGGDTENPPGGVTMRERGQEGSVKLLAGKRLSLLAMAPDDGDHDMEESGGNDELLECSYTGEPLPM